MGKEIELKYSIPDCCSVDEILSHELIRPFISGVSEIFMQSTYYDTREKLLGKKRITLRRRRENDTTVYTVKLPVSSADALSTRAEWNVCADSFDKALCELKKAGCPTEILSLNEDDLCVVASFEFVRKSAKLCYNNFTGELCIDRGYLSPDGVLRAPLYELEIELSDGTPDDLCAYGNKIMAALGLSPESRSKQARARNLK